MAGTPNAADLERLLAERGRQLMQVAIALTGSHQAGEDLLQAALERVMRKPRLVDTDTEGYLRRVLYNLAADGWRRHGRWRQRLPLLRTEEDRPPADGTDVIDLRDALVRLLRQLHLHAADLRDLLLRPRRRPMGTHHGRVHPVHHPGGGVLPPGPAADDRRTGSWRGEGMSAGLSADPALARLADAVLIPPFPGERAPRWVLTALEQGLAGVTIFGPNIAGPEQLAALTAQLRAAGGQPVLAIDEEGGDVTRIAHLTGSRYPGNAALGAVDDVSLTAAVHRALGRDLATLGISVDLAPSVDVNTAADNPVIGIRSFGSDPGLVARHAAAAVSGLQAAGIAACAKHFPGHGSTSTDTHHRIVTIEASLDEVRRRDLPPFAAAIAAGVRGVMPGHLRVPELSGDEPATLSAAALTGLLRGELGFTGVIISDALEMRAVSGVYGIPEAAVRAMAAGTDLLCLGRDTGEDSYLAIRQALSEAVTAGRLPVTRLEEAQQNVAQLRSWLAGQAPALPDGADGQAVHIGLVAARRAVRLSAVPQPLADPVLVELQAAENIAVGSVPWGLGPWLPPGSIRQVPAGLPAGAAATVIAAALSQAAGRSLIVVVRDVHRDPVARAVITGLVAARPDTVVVDMGLPLWQPPGGLHVATYGAAQANAQAAAEVLGLAR